MLTREVEFVASMGGKLGLRVYAPKSVPTTSTTPKLLHAMFDPNSAWVNSRSSMPLMWPSGSVC